MAIKNLGRVVGLSAYETWLAQGNDGTEEDFLATLKGEKGDTGEIGPQGPQGEQGPEGKGAQADWLQNDENADSYIKNRPFYEGTGETVTIVEAGVKDLTLTDEELYIHDYIFSEEEKAIVANLGTVDGTLIVTINGETATTEISVANGDFGPVYFFSEFSVGTIAIRGRSGITCGNNASLDIEVLFVAPGEVVKIDEKFLPENVVVSEDLNDYALKTDVVQSDWNQNDETAPDYVKNRFGGYDITEPIVVIDEKTITLTQSESNIDGNYEYDYYYNLSQEEIALYNEYFGGPNKTAEITINGEKYTDDGSFTVETLNSVFNVETDKYYFFTEMLSNRLLFCFNNIDDVFTEATIKICSIGNSTPVKIDEKYLPDTVATKAYIDEVFNSIINGDEVSY